MKDVSLERSSFWDQSAEAMSVRLGTSANGHDQQNAARNLAESEPDTLSYQDDATALSPAHTAVRKAFGPASNLRRLCSSGSS